MFLLPGQRAPGALDCRPRWNQRRQELSERRRQRLSALLRHDQRGRLPRPRSERLPAGRGQRRDHRPVRGARGSVCARIRWSSGQPFLWRRAGLTHLLCARPDWPAASLGSLSGALRTDHRRAGQNVSTHRDARSRRRRRTRQGHCRSRHGDRRDSQPCRRRRPALHRWLRQCLLSLYQRQRLQCDRHLPRLQARRACLPIPVTPRFIRLASRSAGTINRNSP